jgi:hypothetical protein
MFSFGQPNIVAYLALWLWLPIALFLFYRRKAQEACAMTILFGAMFLPEVLEFDLPLLPAFDKLSIPALGAFIGALIWARPQLAKAKPFSGVDRLVVLLIIGNLFTVLGNRDAIPFARNSGWPLGAHEFIATTIRDLSWIFVPFFLGRALYRTRYDLQQFVKFLVACGLVYSLFALIEVRLSPQLNYWVYGYHQHVFGQTIRFGGYRPMIFMTHGLNVSRFFLGCLLCAAALARARVGVGRLPGWAWVLWLLFVLILCKSTGAILLAAVALPVVWFASPKAQMRFALVLGVLVFLYPALRASDAFPVMELLEWSDEEIGAERAASLEDRFDQEELLLDKLRERPLFGWGGGNRYNIFDPVTGLGTVTTDGEWLVVFGKRGIWGFLCLFGLYLAPVWTAQRRIAALNSSDARLIAGFAVTLAVFAVDNLPNSTGTLPQLFLSGVLTGAVAGIARQSSQEREIARRKRREAAQSSTHPAPGITSGSMNGKIA